MDPSVDWKSLYIQWIEEKRQAAAARQGATYLEKNYAAVLKTLNSTDIGTLKPQRLQSLPGIGAKTCKVLADMAKKYCQQHDLSIDWYDINSAQRGPVSRVHSEAALKSPTRTYVPRYGTTTYNILCGLKQLERLEPGQGFGRDAIARFLKSRQLQNTASSSAKLMPVLTAAFNMLLRKKLIYNRGRQYFLEDEGRALAEKFLAVEKQTRRDLGNPVSSDHPVPDDMPTNSQRTFTDETSYLTQVWAPGEYEICLAIDNREVSSRENRDGFQEALVERGLTPLVLGLPVGDCCWVAQHKATGARAVLDVILERKCLSDLVQSIMDGRFMEQKQRLKKSSIPHVIYLVEGSNDGSREFLVKHAQRIQTAMSQCLAHNGFYLRQTATQIETIMYLHSITTEIGQQLSGKDVHVIEPNVDFFGQSMQKARADLGSGRHLAIDYDSFVASSQKSRSRTVAEIYVQMLMTIKGVSAEKALAIQEIWATPRLLVQAYAKLEEHARGSMIKNATAQNATRRKVGADLSLQISQVWGSGNIAGVLDSHDVDTLPDTLDTLDTL